MVSDEANNCYYFAVKNLSELKSLGWLMGKKEAIINGDNGFLNALDEVLNYQTIETHPERISKLKPYINKYNWEGIEFLAGPIDWIRFERNNKTLHLMYNNKRKKQVILLMITNGKKSHYLAVTSLSALLQGKSSNHKDFYCLNCFNLYTTKNKLKEQYAIITIAVV